MPPTEYVALDTQVAPRKGVEEGDSSARWPAACATKGLMPMSVSQVAERKSPVNAHAGPATAHQARWNWPWPPRQMATLPRAGHAD